MRVIKTGKIEVSEYHIFSDGSRKRVFAYGGTKKLAEKALAEKIAAMEEKAKYGEALDNGELSLGETIEGILRNARTEPDPVTGKVKRAASCESDESVYNILLKPYTQLMKKPVKDITALDLLWWRDQADKHLAKNTGKPAGPVQKNRALHLLKKALDNYNFRMMKQTPTVAVPRWRAKKTKKTMDDFFTPEEIERFVKECMSPVRQYDRKGTVYTARKPETELKKGYAAVIQLLLYMRPSEVLALKVKDYHDDSLHICRNLELHHLITPDGVMKTESAVRTIKNLSSYPYVTEIFDGQCEGKSQEDLMFCTKTGNVIDETDYNRYIKKMVKYLGIDKPVHAHSLRGSGISFAAMNGADMNGVSENAGHADIGTTRKYYTAVYEDHKLAATETAAQAYNDLFGKGSKKETIKEETDESGDV